VGVLGPGLVESLDLFGSAASRVALLQELAEVYGSPVVVGIRSESFLEEFYSLFVSALLGVCCGEVVAGPRVVGIYSENFGEGGFGFFKFVQPLARDAEVGEGIYPARTLQHCLLELLFGFFEPADLLEYDTPVVENCRMI